jgi:hypothetical protein
MRPPYVVAHLIERQGDMTMIELRIASGGGQAPEDRCTAKFGARSAVDNEISPSVSDNAGA